MMEKFAALILSCALACSASAQVLSADQTKKLEVFLSNFTELGLCDFEAKDILDPKAPGDMIAFGILHNYINNKSRVHKCAAKGCKWGALTIEAAHVGESLQRYFNFRPAAFVSIENSDPPYHFDGKLYHFHDPKADMPVPYMAAVKKVQAQSDGTLAVLGNLVLKGKSAGDFKAVVRPHTWNGSPTWSIVSLQPASDS